MQEKFGNIWNYWHDYLVSWTREPRAQAHGHSGTGFYFRTSAEPDYTQIGGDQ